MRAAEALRPSALMAAAVALLAAATLVAACPSAVSSVCKCANDQEGVILHCVDGPLDKLVALLLANQAQLGLLKQLTIQNAAPSTANITARYFDGLYIKKLVVQGCGIESIDAHAFDGLANTLQDLNLAHNRLTALPADSFARLSSLLTLDVANNSIGELSASQSLPTLHKLLEINLSYNRISDVNKAFFDGVKNNINSINLGHNELTTVPASALRGFRQLMALHLHDNKIHTLDALSFMNLPVMSLLNLANNRIRTISRQAFINVPMLRFLYLTDNSIESVAPHQFASFDQLEMLDLTSNRIANLTDGAFAQLAALKQLYLGSNRIADIQAGAFLNSSITVLILEDNQLRDVTEVAFRNMKSLQQLSLKQNRIKNVAQSAFHETPALVIINLSRNEIFDLAPSTFVPLQNVLLIDLSHNQIVRVPYGAFGRRVVTVLLQENPLVCTEHIHMLQQGVGISTPSAEDTVCGAQRHVNETIAAAQPQTAAMPAATNRLGSQQPATAPPAARPSLPPTNTILHNEDTLRDAFRQAELEQHRFEASGGLTQSPRHDGEPKLDPTVPPIADANMPILQRPTVGGAQGSELPIRRLHSRPAAYRTDSIAGDDSARPLIVSGSAGDHSADTRPLAAPAASTAATPHNATRPSGRLVGVDGSTTPDIANIPGRIYPLPVPFLPDKTPRMMQPAISLGSQTLPPSIVIAPTSSAASSASASSKVEPTSGLIAATSPADQRLQKSPPLPTASTSPRASTSNASAPPIRPIVGGKLNAASEVFDVETLTKPVAPTSDAALDAASASAAAADNERAILQGDRSLSTLLIIICLSTVGVVLLAVGVGMCVVHRRRGTAPFIGSAASSTTARSTVPYGTAATSLPTTIVHTHPTQQYLTQNQFSASQLSTMQRARSNSQNATYATPTQVDDVYTWLYSHSPNYSAYAKKS